MEVRAILTQPLMILAGGLFLCCLQARSDEAVLALAPDREIQRAEFRRVHFSNQPPTAILVLCPGQNGTGKDIFSDAAWREFSEANNLAIIVPGFVSDDRDLKAGKGYFEASRGSGALLLKALKTSGWEGVPLLLYGFSGGAHFAMSFSAWAPEKVLGFCAYSFGWWSHPPERLRCPALIACGQHDGIRYGSSFSYFQAGRRQGKPWAWVSLKSQAHERSADLESLVRDFFNCLLISGPSDHVTVDNVQKALVKGEPCNPIMTSILPDDSVFAAWQSLHHP